MALQIPKQRVWIDVLLPCSMPVSSCMSNHVFNLHLRDRLSFDFYYSCAYLMRPPSQGTNHIRHITSVCLVCLRAQVHFCRFHKADAQ